VATLHHPWRVKMDKYCCNCGTNKCGLSFTVRIASDELLNTEAYYILIWKVISQLDTNRREVEEKVIDVFCRKCCITLQNSEGTKIVLPEFEVVFPPDESFSCRWMGRFIEKDYKNFSFPRRFYNASRYKNQYLPLLRVLDVAAKLINPGLFRKFVNK
jgi:hypothetical protein